MTIDKKQILETMETDRIFPKTTARAELQEGLVTDLLVKWRIISPQKFIDAIFNAVEKKVSGMEKKATTDEAGNKVIDIGVAMSFLGKKGGEVNFSEAQASVKELQRASNSFAQQYEKLMSATQQAAGKQLPVDTVKQMLVMMMSVGQISDIITELNKKMDDTTKDVQVKAKEAPKEKEAPAEEEEPIEPSKEGGKEPTVEPNDTKATKDVLDDIPQTKEPEEEDIPENIKAIIDKVRATNKPVKLPKRKTKSGADTAAWKRLQKQYDSSIREINHAIESISSFTSLTDEEAKRIVDEIILYHKIDLNDKYNIAAKIFLIAAQAAEDKITDPEMKAAVQHGLSQKAVGESKKLKTNSGPPRKHMTKFTIQETDPLTSQILEHLEMDGAFKK